MGGLVSCLETVQSTFATTGCGVVGGCMGHGQLDACMRDDGAGEESQTRSTAVAWKTET